MPVGVIKNSADEKKWERAKTAAKKSGGAKNKWALVMHIFQQMKKGDEAENNESYDSLLNDLVEHILETTGTGAVGAFEKPMGMVRYQERSPVPQDLKLDPVSIKTAAMLYPELIPTRKVKAVKSEPDGYDDKRGQRLVHDQHQKLAAWLKAINQGAVNAQKQELALQAKALQLTQSENALKLKFEKDKFALDQKKTLFKEAHPPQVKTPGKPKTPGTPKTRNK